MKWGEMLGWNWLKGGLRFDTSKCWIEKLSGECGGCKFKLVMCR